MQYSALYSSALHTELGTDDSTRLFTTGRRHQAVNDGVLAFALHTECYRRESTLSCSHAVREYNLLSTVNVPGGDFLRFGAPQPEYRHTSSGSTATVTYVAGQDFLRVDIEWLNQYEPGWRGSTGGTPRYWYERADAGRRLIGLHPPPSVGSSEAAIVLLPYLARPPLLSSDTDVPFTSTSGTRTDLEPYHRAIVHYAASQLEPLRAGHEEVRAQLAQFFGYVDRYRRDQRARGLKTVRQARSYFRDARGPRGGGPLDATLLRDY